MTADFVLDSSALLAYLNAEKGIDRVAELLGTSMVMSIVNWCEVLSWYARRGDDAKAISTRLHKEGLIGQIIEIAPLTMEEAMAAATLLAKFPAAGLSLADRVCLGSAITTSRTVITADRTWLKLDLPIEVISIR